MFDTVRVGTFLVYLVYGNHDRCAGLPGESLGERCEICTDSPLQRTKLLLGSGKAILPAEQVIADVAPLDNYAVMLCGRPEFVADMTRQFHERGVPLERIISEDLAFR